ncbi:MaoC family dehydratase [Rhodococcus opacus]|uniref:MaoC family dehydratase n=1 Tax=Rhodococcus opacus TaxID=37919 RepID=UPI00155AA213|nr:MaoC family dehydratase [Rhodococcus opacus]
MTEILRRTFVQADLDRFGRISGGDGLIHTDPDYAAATPFGHTLVQGMLLVGLMERAVGTVAPTRRDTRLDVTFVAPVGPGMVVVIRQVDDADPPRFEAAADGKVVLVATLEPIDQGR